ncbi:autotransporter assembly complex family protein [Yoonia sp.]|uniref:autotransporter assembly complex protein TamA n=1 Tax=Yoonia sp. TaxID=2212373 RepID=UPI0025F4EF4E|nr:BamA/TamA family outer membrane protein [Yoonia sp.]
MKKIWLLIGAVVYATSAGAQTVQLETDQIAGALDDASLLRGLNDKPDAVPQDFVAAARADYRRLLTALYAAGYYGGTISITIDGIEAAQIEPLSAPDPINDIVITVIAGPLFAFGDLSIAPLPPQAVLPADFTTGQPARSDQIRTAVNAGLTSWRDLGFAKARITDQSIFARHVNTALDVDIKLDTGPKLRFGTLNVTGNRTVSDDRIREIAGLPVGEVYAPAEITRAERRLRRTGTFDSAALTEAEQARPGDTLDVNAQIAEAKPRRIGFGLELSSLEGLTVSSFWLHRNLLGGAERLRVDAKITGIAGETGGTNYSLRSNFTRPATFGPDTELYIRGAVSREDEPDYLIDQIGVEVGFTRVLTEDLTAEAGVGLLTAREKGGLGDRNYTLLTLPLRATLDRRDVPTNATAGYFGDIRVTPFVSIDGDVTGARFFADARGFLTFGETRPVTLAARAQLGSLAGAGVNDAPADFLFYSGGGGTVRGQPYKSLGIDRIVNGNAITTGGTSFTGAQLEARFAVTNNIALVGFYDVGHVGDTAVPLEDGDWHAGAGIGLRYNTGIGPIRLDLATQASGDNAGENLQVYIGIGQAF